jgi:HSP20 family protein
MTHVVRWEPFGELGTFRRAMDRLFDDFGPARALRTDVEFAFPVDVSESDTAVTVKAVLPGIAAEDVEITVSEGVLTIRGESREETKEEKENFYRREIRYGSFSRSVPLPTRVNQEDAEAAFADGILTISLPKAADVRPKTIKVKGEARAA